MTNLNVSNESIDIGLPRVSRRIGLSIQPYVEGDWPTIDPPNSDVIDVLLQIVDNDHNVMVEVLPNGDVTYGDTYEPTEAARRFWYAMSSLFPQTEPAQSGTNPEPAVENPDPEAT